MDSAANHIATLEDYLATYWPKPAKKQLGYQSYFAKYLVAQCWKNMCQQTTDWSLQGFILQLGQISEMQLRDVFSYCMEELVPSQSNSKQYNFALGVLLIGMKDVDQIETVIMQPCGCLEFNSEHFTNLVAAFREIRIRGAKQPQDNRLGGYGEATCIKFHRLFIATFLSYGKHLEALQHIDRIDGRAWVQKYE